MIPTKPVRLPEYEYQSLRLPRGTSRNAARQLLTDHAEYGHWELDRLRLYPDGSRTVRLKRRIIRQVRSTW
ncbi:hypothetical protein KCH_67410 [Kitasatospora cheerisanensis KCTC 2395]|uniref:Dihydroorotate dehydrogenase n=1 Tax=Kitasatospora cheerisanensis KCTC 2395 TaxID=1348663 RepID=A0A066YJ30_9ACTN|nr:hypothetical protein KCH_67410 [Kitasatospora cheerisanensis KCTC 2395]